MNNKSSFFSGYDRNSFFTLKPDYKPTNQNSQQKDNNMALHITPPPASKIKGIGEGSFPAVIYGVWDVGLQENEYKGIKKINHTLIVGFETDERIEEEGEYKNKRKVITKRYTVSAYEKATLMKHLAILLGDKCPTEKTFAEFDFESLIGLNCIIGIALTEKGNDKLETLSRPMKGMVPLKPETSPIPPKWVAEAIETGKKNAAIQNVSFPEKSTGHDDFDKVNDDLPF